MGDLPEQRQSEAVRIVGSDENYAADVELIEGKQRLLTDSIVRVEQIFGQDNFADVWFWIDVAGDTGDTIRVQIPAFVDPTGVERSVPAVDKTITITPTEAGKEIILRDYVIGQLNTDPSFSPYWRASSIKDNPIVHISSKFLGEYGERSSFAVLTSGTTQVTQAYANIKKRGKPNSGSRDPRDKRLVTVGISGEVVSVPGAVGDLFLEHAEYNGSSDLRVNGSVTPVTFSIDSDSESDIFIKELRFFGNCNGIKFGQFLSISTLPNGILVEVKSDDKIFVFDAIKMTDDFKHEFAYGGQGFQLHVQAGRDDFLASFNFESAFPIRKSGTFSTNDYVRVHVRDNLSSGLLSLEFKAFGFKREA